jgi:hypothetical protein
MDNEDPDYTPCSRCHLPVHADRATWQVRGNDLVPVCEKCIAGYGRSPGRPPKAAGAAKKATKSPKAALRPGPPEIASWRLFRAIRHEKGNEPGWAHFQLRVKIVGHCHYASEDLTISPDGKPYPANIRRIEVRFPSIVTECVALAIHSARIQAQDNPQPQEC